SVEVDAPVRRHEADLLAIRALVSSIPEKPGGDLSVFVGEADQRHDRTNLETRDLRLVGSQAREEADHRVVGGLSTVRRVPEPAPSGDEARSVLGGERLREADVTANRARPHRVPRDILERVHGGDPSLYRGAV